MKNEYVKPIALALGIIFGALTGILTDNLILWLGIGIALGAARGNSTKCAATGTSKKQNLRSIALIGGFGYLVIFVSGIYANFVVLESLKVANDDIVTFKNFINNRETFITGIFSFVIMVLADLVLTWSLHALFRIHNQKRSAIAAWFRLVNVIFFAVALFHLFEIVQLTNPQELLIHSQEFLANQVDRELSDFSNTWLIGLVFFGVHLILLANLMLKHIRIPKFIPVLLMIAGLGYLVDSVLQFTYFNYQDISEVSVLVVVLPGVVGELSLTFWLLFYKPGKHIINNKIKHKY